MCYNYSVTFIGAYDLHQPLPSIIQNFAFCNNCDYEENRLAVFLQKICNYTKLKFCKRGAHLMRERAPSRLIVGEGKKNAKSS